MSSSGWSAIVSGSPLTSATSNVKAAPKTGPSRHRQWMSQPHRRGRTTRGARSRSRSRSRSRVKSGVKREEARRQRSKTRKEPDSLASSRTRSRSQSLNRSRVATSARTRPRPTSHISNRSASLRSRTTVVAAPPTTASPTTVTPPPSTQTIPTLTGDGDRDVDDEEEVNEEDLEDVDYESAADTMTPAFHMPTKVDYFPGALAPPLVKLFRYVHQHRDEYIQALQDIVGVRSVSSRPDCWPNVVRLLSWVELRLKRLGASTDMVSVPRQKAVRDYNGRPLTPPPVLLATLGQAGERRRLLVYLHVDAAPLWGSCEALAPPCELTFQDSGRTMQGRGVFECKGPLLCWLLALEALHHMHVQVPVALKFLVQGAHEIGSPGLEELLTVRRRSFLRDVDAICVTKLSWLTQCKPCVVHGLRGLVYFHLEVKAGPTNMDSGHVGGSVTEPLADLIYLLNSLQDRSGEPAIEGLMQGVPPLSREEEKHLSHVAFDCAQLRSALGAPKLRFNENKTEILKHRWRLPSLSFHGIQGALSGAGSATGLPRAVVGKFSVRLVPKQTPERAAAAVRRHVEAAWAARHSPNHMRLTVTATARPWLESATSPHFSAARRAAKRVYKVEPDVIRDGGSMEVVLLLQRLCPRSLVVLPLGAGGGAHSADETLRVNDFLDGIKLVASYMFEVSQVKGPKNEISVGNAYDITKRREQAVAAAAASGKIRSITVPVSRVLGQVGSISSVSSVQRPPVNRTPVDSVAAKSGSLSCPQSNINSVFCSDDAMMSMTSIAQTTLPSEVTGGSTAAAVAATRTQSKVTGGAPPAAPNSQPYRRPKRPGIARRRSLTHLIRPHILLASVSETVSAKKPSTKVSGKVGAETHSPTNKTNYGAAPKAWMVNKSPGPVTRHNLGPSKAATPVPARVGLTGTTKTATGTFKATMASSKAGLATRSKHSKVNSSRQEDVRAISPTPSQSPPSLHHQHQQQESQQQQRPVTPPLDRCVSRQSDPTTPSTRSRSGVTPFGGGGNAAGGRSSAALHKRRSRVTCPPKPVLQCGQFIASNVPAWLRRPIPRTPEPLVTPVASQPPSAPPPTSLYNDMTASALGLAASKVMQHLPLSPPQSFSRALPVLRPRKRLLK